ncbi:hypothetical protein [Mesorhizobium sp. M0243]|uniref:hypothetical protein n=1 Tax=Mesorhizobium sp. M0243 TaxID=2956925 RepID=UPI00333BEC0B
MMPVFLAENDNCPLKLIDQKTELIDFLVNRLRESLPEVFTFQQTFEDVSAMATELGIGDSYRPPYDSADVLLQTISSEDPEVVRCGEGLLRFYRLLHFVADHHGRALSTAEIARTALIALKADKTVSFVHIIDPPGVPSNVLLIASEPAFEEKFGARIRVITKIKVSGCEPSKGNPVSRVIDGGAK